LGVALIAFASRVPLNAAVEIPGAREKEIRALTEANFDGDGPGSWNGTATHLLLDLKNGLTVAVLSNDEKADVSDLAEEILALFRSDL
jgi:hypothetical protein